MRGTSQNIQALAHVAPSTLPERRLFGRAVSVQGAHYEAAQVRITFLRVDGTTPVRPFTVPAARLFTTLAHEIPELANASFGALIEVTSGPGTFVERAPYSDSQGVVFAAGMNALATLLA